MAKKIKSKLKRQNRNLRRGKKKHVSSKKLVCQRGGRTCHKKVKSCKIYKSRNCCNQGKAGRRKFMSHDCMWYRDALKGEKCGKKKKRTHCCTIGKLLSFNYCKG